MSEDKIPVSLVSYTNSKPFLYGLQNSVVMQEISLMLDTPADCARKLMSGEATIGLVPVAAIEKIPSAQLITNFGIAAVGKVDSVLLLSNVELENIKTVLLDYQSMTSVRLVQVLANNYWKKDFEYVAAQPGFESNIKGDIAGVVIGDRALNLKNRFPFVYDLSGEWFNYTRFPFVFARWVSNKTPDPGFLDRFSSALQDGINCIDELVTEMQQKETFSFDVTHYLKHSIHFSLTDDMKKGMDLFLSLAKNLR